MVVMDVGYGRICMHPESGFVLALLVHDAAAGGEFCELDTGLDHIGLAAVSRAELEEWQQLFGKAEVHCSSGAGPSAAPTGGHPGHGDVLHRAFCRQVAPAPAEGRLRQVTTDP